MAVPRLSKSRYTSFLECPVQGYLRSFPARFGSYGEWSAEQRDRLETGTRVGELAREYFSGGVLIEAGADGSDMKAALRATHAALEAGCGLLYEATFVHDHILVRADILRRLADGSWELTEVKSGTDAEKHHGRYAADIGVQVHVLEACGLAVSRAYLMLLDRGYVHPGGESYDPVELFRRVDMTAASRAHAATELPGNLRTIRALLAKTEPPFRLSENACRGACEYCASFCEPRGPLYPVTEFGRARKAWELLIEAGVLDARAINEYTHPEAFALLTRGSRAARHLRHLQSVQSGRLVVDEGLSKALAGLAFPLHFFDFESWAPALPVFPGTHPYEQVVFQWSDHCLQAEGTLDAAAFLADGRGDPRRQVAESLLARLGSGGSIVVYHAPFERGRLRELAALYPDLSAGLHGVENRVVDLLPLVADHVYHPEFHGSFSLKRVLPALCPGVGYGELAIQEGTAAARAFRDLRLLPDGGAKEDLRRNMLAYCARDTEAMVAIFRVLRSLA
jgi:hypothetical protein